MATLISVPNETQSSASRITKEGKKITYKLNVIQQPERARACGSGAKSSADRRPVDPPPIVELRVFEGSEEITFSYNANFFLFATLENARTIAQGRVPSSASSIPVLTGTPVAGMAYLDRPSPAGYFIFPDLSVRHEGKYRLSFSLYEELKETKDMDTEEIQNLEILAQTSQHVSHRLEVKSTPFTVFSAKKFPGLTESTALSRMVAEQGCRVRIRRDVRMRRRETKSKDEWDEYDDAHARQSRTPDAYGQQAIPTPQTAMDGSDRPRSMSDASVASFSMPQRRLSAEQMGQAYQQPYGQQMAAPSSQSMYPSQMSYPAPPPPPPQHQQPQYSQAPSSSSLMQPPQVPYQPAAPQYAPPPPPPPPPQQAYGYMQQQQPPQAHQQQQYSQPQAPAPQPAYDHGHHPHVRHNSMDFPTDYRRASGHQQPTSQPQYNGIAQPTTSPPYGHVESSYPPTTQPSYVSSPTESTGYQNGWTPNGSWGSRRSTMTSAPSTLPGTQPQALAPIRTLSHSLGVTQKLEPTSPSYHSPLSAEQVHSPGYADLSRGGQPPYGGAVQQPQQAQQSSYAHHANGGKRTYSASFDTHHMEQPLRYGARPNVNGHEELYHNHAHHQQHNGHHNGHHQHQHYDAGSDGEPVSDDNAMSYRRADGTERRRRIPASS